MKIYLILLVISGIAHLINYLEIKVVIKKYDFVKINEPLLEEKILAGIKALILWALIVPQILGLLGNLLNHDAYVEGICNGLENSEFWG
jgi:hypothetical protein